MTNPRPGAQEPREGMRASPDLPLLPPSPISPVSVQESSSSRPTSSSPSIEDSRVGSPASDLSMSDSSDPSDNDQVAPSSSPETYQRGARRGFSAEQLAVISKFYGATPYPSREQYQQLATSLSVDTKSIKLWFQNRRCKARKQVTRQEQEPEAPRVSSDDVKDIGSSGAKRNQHDIRAQTDVDDVKPVVAVSVDTSGPADYKEMTIMSLPADHPFCQLLPVGPSSRRARRPAAHPRPSVDSPVARPPYARGRSKYPKKAVQKMDTPLPVASVAPPATVVVKPEVARLWRPIDDPRSAPSPPQQVPVKQERPPSAASPLDLSVSLKRKRDGAAATASSGDAMDASGKKHAGEMSSLHPAALPAGYPMMFPGAAFPFYGPPAGGAYMPVMPQMAFPMPHLPMGLYGQPVSMWGGGMPGLPQPQKPVR